MFGTAEHPHPRTAPTAQVDEVELKLRRLRQLLDRRGLRAAVLSGTDSVSWLTGGLTERIEPGNPLSSLWLVVTAEAAYAVTTNVEQPRLAAESGLDALGFALVDVPWYEPGGLAAATRELAGADPLGALDDDLVELRLALLPPEWERLAALATDATSALQDALRSWRPGQTDLDVRSRVAGALEQTGAFGACLIVGGDERVARFRHPLSAGLPMRRLVMAVVVAERHGLHVAATRFASAGALQPDARRARQAALLVERTVLDACRPGATYGDALVALDHGYDAAGHPEAWREHYQGGPIGYRQREFEIVPSQTESRWFGTPIGVGHALAWNPSVRGGGKVEDTYLVEPTGLQRLTAADGWPLEDGRPAVLDIETGGAA
jgi:Xaa-Pro dipeptidase